MKRVFFILLVVSTTCYSQSMIGIKPGANHTNFDFNHNWSHSGLQGINAGLVFKYYNEPHLGIQLELNYSQRGAKEKTQDSSSIRKYNYLEVPFMMHIQWGNKGKFFVNLGPNFAYNLFGTDYDKILDVEVKSRHKFSIDENRFDFGIVLGGGFIFNTSIGEFQLEPRFQYGLNNVIKEKDPELHSNYLILSLSVAYLIKAEKYLNK